MSFEEEFPGLKGSYICDYDRAKVNKIKLYNEFTIKRNCLSKKKVSDALEELIDLVITDDFKKKMYPSAVILHKLEELKKELGLK